MRILIWSFIVDGCDITDHEKTSILSCRSFMSFMREVSCFNWRNWRKCRLANTSEERKQKQNRGEEKEIEEPFLTNENDKQKIKKKSPSPSRFVPFFTFYDFFAEVCRFVVFSKPLLTLETCFVPLFHSQVLLVATSINSLSLMTTMVKRLSFFVCYFVPILCFLPFSLRKLIHSHFWNRLPTKLYTCYCYLDLITFYWSLH